MDLLPCPFCGGAASLVIVDEHSAIYAVTCDQCGAEGAWNGDKEQTTAAWNARAMPVSQLTALKELFRDWASADEMVTLERGTPQEVRDSEREARDRLADLAAIFGVSVDDLRPDWMD